MTSLNNIIALSFETFNDSIHWETYQGKEEKIDPILGYGISEVPKFIHFDPDLITLEEAKKLLLKARIEYLKEKLEGLE